MDGSDSLVSNTIMTLKDEIETLNKDHKNKALKALKVKHKQAVKALEANHASQFYDENASHTARINDQHTEMESLKLEYSEELTRRTAKLDKYQTEITGHDKENDEH